MLLLPERLPYSYGPHLKLGELLSLRNNSMQLASIQSSSSVDDDKRGDPRIRPACLISSWDIAILFGSLTTLTLGNIPEMVLQFSIPLEIGFLPQLSVSLDLTLDYRKTPHVI